MFSMMIVDDSNIMRRKIERLQQDTHFNIVASATNGKQAIDLFKQHHPDIITMDLTMPELDGIDTIPLIRQLSQRVKILVVSALNDKATAIRALQQGAQGFVCKPFSDTELQDALLELVED